MRNVLQEQEILEDILNHFRKQFGYTIESVNPIHKGWLNLKWKIETSNGAYLLKQYNRERLKKYSISELKHVFQIQNNLHQLGFPCPKVHAHGTDLFFQSSGGEYYIVMDYCSGNTAKAGTLTESQMFDLGYFTGKLHYIVNKNFSSVHHTTAFQPPTREERHLYWTTMLKNVHSLKKYHLEPIMEKQLKLTEFINPEEFITRHTGLAHRDLWVDNMLFDSNGLGAILDFDRMKQDFLTVDIGRAIISGALDGEHFKVQHALAFLEGYRNFYPNESCLLTKSLKLLWYMESEWWLDADLDVRKGPPIRFVQEMLWLSEHLLELEDLLGNQ
jgi:homoserine kinase type II